MLQFWGRLMCLRSPKDKYSLAEIVSNIGMRSGRRMMRAFQLNEMGGRGEAQQNPRGENSPSPCPVPFLSSSSFRDFPKDHCFFVLVDFPPLCPAFHFSWISIRRFAQINSGTGERPVYCHLLLFPLGCFNPPIHTDMTKHCSNLLFLLLLLLKVLRVP